MASYPTSIISLATHNDGDTIFAADINTPNAEIVAVETGLINGFQHVLKPLTDNTYDLGTTALNWRDIFLKRNLTNNGYAGVGAAIISNASKQIVEQVLTNGQLIIGNTGAAPTIGTLTAGAGITVTNGGGTITVAATAASLTLLKSNSGTDTTTTATNVDTVAISGLTAKDRLIWNVEMGSTTQQTTTPVLYNSTDAVTIVNLLAGNSIVAGTVAAASGYIAQRQTAATSIIGMAYGLNAVGNTPQADLRNNSSVTAWTGSWTLALRHGGVTSGGTFDWTWSVYKLAGQ